MKKGIALLGALCAAGLGAGSAFAEGATTASQLSLNDLYRACPEGCGVGSPGLTGDLRNAVWTVVEGELGPDLEDPMRDKVLGPQVTPVVAQIPYAVTGNVADPGYTGQHARLDGPAGAGTAVRGQVEQPQGLPRALFAALIALIGIVAVARRGMSHKD